MLSNFPFDFFFNPWILEMGLHSFWMFGYFPEIFLLLLSDLILLWTEKTLWIYLKNLSGYAWVLSAHSTAWKKLPWASKLENLAESFFQGSLSVVTWDPVSWNALFHIFYSIFQFFSGRRLNLNPVSPSSLEIQVSNLF